MRILITLLLFLAVLNAPARGLQINGRLTSSLYTYEGQKNAATTTGYLRAYQSLRLDLGDLVLPGLSFHTYLRGTSDLTEQSEADPRLRIYSTYLTWKKSRYQIHLGRQRIYAGVGYGSIDGMRTHAKIAGFDLTFYAGMLVPLNTSAEVNSWSAGNLWGARLSTRRFFGTNLSLSFANREREREAYEQPGQYSGLLVGPQAIVQRLIGLDLNRHFAAGHNLYGRLDFDLKDESLRRAEVSARYAVSSNLSAQVEWFRRAPSVFYNSIFSVFPSEVYREIGTRLFYAVKPGLQLTAHFANVLYDGDSAQRLGLIAGIGAHYSIGYYRSMGYSRASDGLVGSIFYPFTRKLLLKGELDLSSYERAENIDDREELVTGSLGLTYRPTRSLSLDLQVQGLRNPVYVSDTRLFLRGSWRFFKRGER